MLTDNERASAVREYMAHTTGTDAYHKITLLNNVIATDGIRFFAETCQCFWLIDAVASHQRSLKPSETGGFVLWRLRPVGDRGAMLEAWNDTPEDERSKGDDDDFGPAKMYVSQEFESVSVPRELLPFTFWQEGNVLLLKEER